MKTIVILLCYSLVWVTLAAQSGRQTRPYTKAETRAIDAVKALPEVKELFRIYADSPRHIDVMIASDPDKYSNNYWIKVGQYFYGDSDDYYQYFLGYYEFYVNAKTYNVKNNDVLTNTPISLKKWRAKMKKKLD